MASAAATIPAEQQRPASTTPPGPRWPAAAQTVAWAVALPWVLDRCRERYGEAFTLRFFPSGRKIVVVSGWSGEAGVLAAPPEVAPSAAGTSPIAAGDGAELGAAPTARPGAHPSAAPTAAAVPRGADERVRGDDRGGHAAARHADVADGEPASTQERARAITEEVILRAVFGVCPVTDPLARGDRRAGPAAAVAMLLRIALSRPTAERPKGAFGQALDGLDEEVYAEIARRRAMADLGERKDILSLLMQARDEEGAAMQDSELRDELVTLLLAGHETTATTVAWAIERLVRHPDKLERLTAQRERPERRVRAGGRERDCRGCAR